MMPGPSLDQGQLQSKVDWALHHGPISFANFRYSGLIQEQTDQNGIIWVDFVPAFTNEILGFHATLDFSGGLRRWTTGSWQITRSHFGFVTWDPYNIVPVVNTTVGFYYMAIGR